MSWGENGRYSREIEDGTSENKNKTSGERTDKEIGGEIEQKKNTVWKMESVEKTKKRSGVRDIIINLLLVKQIQAVKTGPRMNCC